MNLTEFIQKINNNEIISFNETISIINENYQYQPTEFKNGLGSDTIINAAGSNEGSCKIFAFALLNKLTQSQTLNLFGDYYHQDVLVAPSGNDHGNIRNFMKYGWVGISFKSTVLNALI